MSRFETETEGQTGASVASGAVVELRQGWRTILVAGVGVCAGVTGLPFYSIGLMIRPMSAEFGWSRAAVSSAALFLQLGIVLSAPIVGRLVDRIGLRRVALTSLVCLAATFALMPLLGDGIAGYYAAWLLLSLVGCGTTPLVWTRAVVGRFTAARGLALGLTLLGTGIAGIIAPTVIGPIILDHGWRAGCLCLAATVLFIAAPLTYLLLAEPAPVQRRAVTLRHPIGTMFRERPFAQLAGAFLLLGLGITGLIVHLVPILIDHGYSERAAAGSAALLGLAVMAGRLLVGALVDRLPPTRVAFTFLILPVVACILLLLHGPALLAVLLLGLAAGAEIDLLAYFASQYFPVTRYGATYGWALAIFSLGAGFGPVLAGAIFDSTHGYGTVLLLSAALITIAASMIGMLGQPRLP